MAGAQQAQEFTRRQPHPYKKDRFSHTQNTKYGMGDNYGTGVKAKLGTDRSDTNPVVYGTPKRLKVPPRSLV